MNYTVGQKVLYIHLNEEGFIAYNGDEGMIMEFSNNVKQHNIGWTRRAEDTLLLKYESKGSGTFWWIGKDEVKLIQSIKETKQDNEFLFPPINQLK